MSLDKPVAKCGPGEEINGYWVLCASLCRAGKGLEKDSIDVVGLYLGRSHAGTLSSSSFEALR